MIYLAQTFWPFLALAFVLGLGFGWFTWKKNGDETGFSLWFLLVAALAIIAILKLLPERTGFWLDLGTMLLILYVVGCLLGAYLRSGFSGLNKPTKMAAAASMAVTQPAPAMASDSGETAKPAGLAAPRGGGKADDLKRIKGIGKQNEGRLHGLGIWHFDQIAAWTDEEVRWVGHFLAFPGRIEREEWVAQAKVLAEGGETAFSKRADAGEVATSRDDADDDGQGNIIPVEKGKA
jgi:predicted flap endonuclease-1-like 5' DNA nuclease